MFNYVEHSICIPAVQAWHLGLTFSVLSLGQLFNPKIPQEVCSAHRRYNGPPDLPKLSEQFLSLVVSNNCELFKLVVLFSYGLYLTNLDKLLKWHILKSEVLMDIIFALEPDSLGADARRLQESAGTTIESFLWHWVKQQPHSCLLRQLCQLCLHVLIFLFFEANFGRGSAAFDLLCSRARSSTGRTPPPTCLPHFTWRRIASTWVPICLIMPLWSLYSSMFLSYFVLHKYTPLMDTVPIACQTLHLKELGIDSVMNIFMAFHVFGLLPRWSLGHLHTWPEAKWMGLGSARICPKWSATS